MKTPAQHHRVWYFHAVIRLRRRACEHCAQQFTRRMERLLADYERDEFTSPEMLEALRTRELARLLGEAHPGPLR